MAKTGEQFIWMLGHRETIVVYKFRGTVFVTIGVEQVKQGNPWLVSEKYDGEHRDWLPLPGNPMFNHDYEIIYVERHERCKDV